ncbi:uncharacterized protein LOC114231274 isoform X2 [Eptesicus fuscus]|uniref:uncharacterized protein LOC114231274 isoform X2 n=1 Tax=Eptesicus fuscus TaxID=29078 RepID=UPI0024045EA8|nr:uncharacterized protein LOC114231274 isoform X2 [Eptesicus fuscus]
MTHTGGSKKRHPGPRALSSRLPGPPAPLSTPSLAPAPARAAPGLTAWPLALDACTFPLRVAASASALGKVHPTPTPPGPLRPRGRPPHPDGRPSSRPSRDGWRAQTFEWIKIKRSRPGAAICRPALAPAGGVAVAPRPLLSQALTSQAHRHPHLLRREQRREVAHSRPSRSRCRPLPRAAPLPLPGRLGRRNPVHFSGPGCLRRACSCSCLLEPDTGSAFCLGVLRDAWASSLFSLLLCFFPLTWGGAGEQGNEMFFSVSLILPQSPPPNLQAADGKDLQLPALLGSKLRFSPGHGGAAEAPPSGLPCSLTHSEGIWGSKLSPDCFNWYKIGIF